MMTTWQPDTVLKANSSGWRHFRTDGSTDLTSALSRSIQQFLEASRNEIRGRLRPQQLGSSGEHTGTGKPLMANDSILELRYPPSGYAVISRPRVGT